MGAIKSWYDNRSMTTYVSLPYRLVVASFSGDLYEDIMHVDFNAKRRVRVEVDPYAETMYIKAGNDVLAGPLSEEHVTAFFRFLRALVPEPE